MSNGEGSHYGTESHGDHHAATTHGGGQIVVPSAQLNRLAVSATTHCLTGCVIGEVTGM